MDGFKPTFHAHYAASAAASDDSMYARRLPRRHRTLTGHPSHKPRPPIAIPSSKDDEQQWNRRRDMRWQLCHSVRQRTHPPATTPVMMSLFDQKAAGLHQTSLSSLSTPVITSTATSSVPLSMLSLPSSVSCRTNHPSTLFSTASSPLSSPSAATTVLSVLSTTMPTLLTSLPLSIPWSTTSVTRNRLEQYHDDLVALHDDFVNARETGTLIDRATKLLCPCIGILESQLVNDGPRQLRYLTDDILADTKSFTILVDVLGQLTRFTQYTDHSHPVAQYVCGEYLKWFVQCIRSYTKLVSDSDRLKSRIIWYGQIHLLNWVSHLIQLPLINGPVTIRSVASDVSRRGMFLATRDIVKNGMEIFVNASYDNPALVFSKSPMDFLIRCLTFTSDPRMTKMLDSEDVVTSIYVLPSLSIFYNLAGSVFVTNLIDPLFQLILRAEHEHLLHIVTTVLLESVSVRTDMDGSSRWASELFLREPRMDSIDYKRSDGVSYHSDRIIRLTELLRFTPHSSTSDRYFERVRTLFKSDDRMIAIHRVRANVASTLRNICQLRNVGINRLFLIHHILDPIQRVLKTDTSVGVDNIPICYRLACVDIVDALQETVTEDGMCLIEHGMIPNTGDSKSERSYSRDTESDHVVRLLGTLLNSTMGTFVMNEAPAKRQLFQCVSLRVMTLLYRKIRTDRSRVQRWLSTMIENKVFLRRLLGELVTIGLKPPPGMDDIDRRRQTFLCRLTHYPDIPECTLQFLVEIINVIPATHVQTVMSLLQTKTTLDLIHSYKSRFPEPTNTILSICSESPGGDGYTISPASAASASFFSHSETEHITDHLRSTKLMSSAVSASAAGTPLTNGHSGSTTIGMKRKVVAAAAHTVDTSTSDAVATGRSVSDGDETSSAIMMRSKRSRAAVGSERAAHIEEKKDSAIRFVYESETQPGKLVINPMVKAIFESCKTDVGAMLVVGPSRTGKSSLCNRLSKSRRFRVDGSVQACTKGIDLDPIPRQFYDKETNSFFNCFLMDTEGLDHLRADTTMDVFIITIALLIGSRMFYNTMGKIEKRDVELMAMAMKVAETIQIEKDKTPKDMTTDELLRVMPTLTWVIQSMTLTLKDASGKPITAKQYLEDDAFASSPEIRKTLCHAFPIRECFPLSPPCYDRADEARLVTHFDQVTVPQYRAELDKLEAHIESTSRPKYVCGRRLSGAAFYVFVETIVNNINSGSQPIISDTYTMWCEHVWRDCEAHARQRFHDQMVLIVSQIQGQSSTLPVLIETRRSIDLFYADETKQYMARIDGSSEQIAKFHQRWVQYCTVEVEHVWKTFKDVVHKWIRKQAVGKINDDSKVRSVDDMRTVLNMQYEQLSRTCLESSSTTTLPTVAVSVTGPVTGPVAGAVDTVISDRIFRVEELRTIWYETMLKAVWDGLGRISTQQNAHVEGLTSKMETIQKTMTDMENAYKKSQLDWSQERKTLEDDKLRIKAHYELELKGERDKIEIRTAEWAETNEKERREKEVLEVKVQELTAALTDKDHTLQLTLDDWKNRHGDATRKADMVEHQLRLAMDTTGTLQKEIGQLREQVASMRMMESKCQELMQKNQHLAEEIREYQSQMEEDKKETRMEMARLVTKHKKMEESNSTWTRKNRELEHALAEHQERLKQMTEQLSLVHKQLTDATALLERERTQHTSEMKTTVDEYKSKESEWTKRVLDTEQTLRHRNESVTMLSSRIGVLQQQINEMTDLKSELIQHQSALTKSQCHVENLKSQVTHANDEITRLQKQTLDKTQEVHECQRQLQAKTMELERANFRLSHLNMMLSASSADLSPYGGVGVGAVGAVGASGGGGAIGSSTATASSTTMTATGLRGSLLGVGYLSEDPNRMGRKHDSAVTSTDPMPTSATDGAVSEIRATSTFVRKA